MTFIITSNGSNVFDQTDMVCVCIDEIEDFYFSLYIRHNYLFKLYLKNTKTNVENIGKTYENCDNFFSLLESRYILYCYIYIFLVKERRHEYTYCNCIILRETRTRYYNVIYPVIGIILVT